MKFTKQNRSTTWISKAVFVSLDANSLKKDLGYSDRQKFAEYYDSLRAIERQMDRLETMKNELSQVTMEEPPEAYLPRGEYIRLMGDLMVDCSANRANQRHDVYGWP